MSADYNPNSMDASLARIESGIDQLHKQIEEIKTHVEKTNGRVTTLEDARIKIYAVTATVATVVTSAVAFAWQYVIHVN